MAVHVLSWWFLLAWPLVQTQHQVPLFIYGDEDAPAAAFSPTGPPDCGPAGARPPPPTAGVLLLTPAAPCPSCRDRCGHTWALNEGRCSCDAPCVAYGDCCEDFRLQCPIESNVSAPLSNQFKRTGGTCMKYWRAPDNSSEATHKSGSNYLVSVCGSTDRDCYVPATASGAPINLQVPVYDPTTGVHYVNARCAACNGAVEVEPWPLVVDCSNRVTDQQNDTYTVETEDDIMLYLTNHSCKVIYDMQRLQNLHTCVKPMISTCSANCQDEELNRLCHNEYQTLAVHSSPRGYARIYKNSHCGRCQGNALEDMDCGRVMLFSWSGALEKPILQVHLPVMLRFDKREGLVIENGKQVGNTPEIDVRSVSKGDCLEGRGLKWLGDELACHALTCPSQTHLVRGDCLPDVENIDVKVVISSDVGQNTSAEVATTLWEKEADLREKITSRITELLTPRVSPMDRIATTVIFSSSPIITVKTAIVVYFHRKSSSSLMENFGRTQEDLLVSWLRETFVTASLTNGTAGVAARVDVSIMKAATHSPTCTWLLYSESEYVISDDVLTVTNTTRSYGNGAYERGTFHDAVVCVRCSPRHADDCLSAGVTFTNGLLRLLLFNVFAIAFAFLFASS